jgi:hypothetical protein
VNICATSSSLFVVFQLREVAGDQEKNSRDDPYRCHDRSGQRAFPPTNSDNLKASLQRGIPDEVRLAVSLALFAIAGIMFWRFKYCMVWDRGLREFILSKDMPRHVWIWNGIAIALIIAG